MSQKRLSCAQCDAPLPNCKGRGKPRRYCSDACKAAAHRRGNTRRSPGNEQRQCQQCGGSFTGKGAFSGDSCHYQANKHALPADKRHMAAWDEALVPWVPMGQQAALDLNRPAWHAWVYGGEERSKQEESALAVECFFTTEGACTTRAITPGLHSARRIVSQPGQQSTR